MSDNPIEWPGYADDVDVSCIRELYEAAEDFLRHGDERRGARLRKALNELRTNIAHPFGPPDLPHSTANTGGRN